MPKKYAVLRLNGWVCEAYYHNAGESYDFLICRGGTREITRKYGVLVPHNVLERCGKFHFMRSGLPEYAARKLETWCLEERPLLLDRAKAGLLEQPVVAKL